MIACTYIISVILWPPWIISWPYIEGQCVSMAGNEEEIVAESRQLPGKKRFIWRKVHGGARNMCGAVSGDESLRHCWYAVAAFYLPVTILIVLYSRVYWETRKRRRDFGKLQASQFPRRSMRRDTSTNSFAKNNERGSLKKGAWSVNDSKRFVRTLPHNESHGTWLNKGTM
ncbi:hypothetical protein OSTOST_25293 [Ostertagia ostertagi]